MPHTLCCTMFDLDLQHNCKSRASADEEDDSSDDDNEDELLTLTDAVHHVARSTRQSRANSDDVLDELDPPAGPSNDPAAPTPMAPPAQPQAAPRVTFEDAGHLAIPGSAVRSVEARIVCTLLSVVLQPLLLQLPGLPCPDRNRLLYNEHSAVPAHLPA